MASLRQFTSPKGKMSQPRESTWAYRELLRIDALQDAEVIHELCRAMNGYTYSWESIDMRLGHLDANDTVYLDWRDLCRLKETWDSFPSLTRERQHQDIMQGLSPALGSPSWNPRLFRTLLLNLRLILIRARFEEEQAIQLVSQNLDATKFGPPDLWMKNESWVAETEGDEQAPLLGVKAKRFWRKWFFFI